MKTRSQNPERRMTEPRCSKGGWRRRFGGWCSILLLAGLLNPGSAAGDHYVAQNGQTSAIPYTSWATAASNIQDAVNAAAVSSTVWVAVGRYTVPTNAVDFGGTNLVYINQPMTIRGASGNPADVVLNGQSKYRGVAVLYSGAEGEQIILDSLTLSNCSATTMGGGVVFDSWGTAWEGRLVNCIVVDNVVTQGSNKDFMWDPEDNVAYGGGIAARNAAAFDLTITNCILRGNRTVPATTVMHRGGGLYTRIFGGDVIIVDSLVEDNSAYEGGGLVLRQAASVCRRCIIRNNTASATGSEGGAGIFGNYDSTTLYNCLIYGNSGGQTGAFHMQFGLGAIYNCTITGNSGGSFGGVRARRVLAWDTEVRIWNSIIYDNLDRFGAQNNLAYDSTTNSAGVTNISVTNTCIVGPGDMPGSGNISSNPQFLSAAGEDYRLHRDSSCIDQGLLQGWMASDLDLDGRSRVYPAGKVDMGAYEWYPTGTAIMVR